MTVAVERDRSAAVIEEAVHGIRMNRLQVVDLEERIHQHFDVALHVEAFLHDEAPLQRLKLAEVLGEGCEMLLQRLRLRVFVDEHPVVEALAADLHERARLHVEPDEIALVAQID